jgi:ribonucleoside-diphosphate reductase alpha chain
MGPLHFMEWTSKTKETISQGSTRRGEHAVFLDVYHPDIMEFLNINGEGSKLQRLPFGVCIPDSFVENLKNYGQKEMEIQAAILDSRNRTGFPYIFFTDTVNNNTVDVYKDLGKKIKSTNMCTECLLPSDEEESFVCDIMSMRFTKYDEWKNTDAVRIGVYIADAVLLEFIDMYEGTWGLERAVKFAKNHMAIGFGASGYHSYLQSKSIPFESWEAKSINIEVFKRIKEDCYATSKEMFEKYGASEMMTPYGRRHSCLNFCAPNTSSSFIFLQESQSFEPYVSNYYIKKTAKVKMAVKNPYLMKVLEEKDKNTTEVWESILKNEGSVAHLDFLSEHEKLVFRTFIEISQMEIIIQASSRQKYIDQGQSLNLMIHPMVPTKEVNALILKAHELGIKTLYYQLGQNASQQFVRSLNCEACAG